MSVKLVKNHLQNRLSIMLFSVAWVKPSSCLTRLSKLTESTALQMWQGTGHSSLGRAQAAHALILNLAWPLRFCSSLPASFPPWAVKSIFYGGRLG